MLLVVALGGGIEAWTLKQSADSVQARLGNHLAQAADELNAGKTAVATAASRNDAGLLDTAHSDFESARGHFLAARRIATTDPLLARAASVPPFRDYIHKRVSSVVGLSAMGVALCDAGEDGEAIDRHLILTPGSANLHGGARLIASLNAAAPLMDRIAADLERAKDGARQVDVTVLPTHEQATFIKARDQIDSSLAGTLQFKALAPALLEILGANGARTYMVENIDPAELRGGGGFMGSYILVGADKGEIKLGTSGNVYDLDYPYPVKGQKKYVAPPNSLNEFATHGWVLGDSNFYADFPANARAGADLFKRESGKSVDGVIGLDFWAVAEMLKLTGPVDVPEYGTRVEASTFVDETVHRLLTTANNVPGKKAFFPVVAAKVLDRLTTIDTADWSNLIGHLNTTVTERHLQVFFNNEQAEREMAQLGWGGAQAAPAGQPAAELVQEVEANYGGNKANYWLTRAYNVDLTLDSAGNLKHTFRVSLKNQTPPGFEGGQFYRAYFRFYYPESATDASAGGLLPDKYPSDEKPAGLKLLDGWYQMPAYSSYDRVAFSYTTKVTDLASGHRIYWLKQPGTIADKIHVTLHVDGKTFTADGDLGGDRVLVVTADGVKLEAGQAGNARIPLVG